eukprot:TRINITY_DN2028_c0_g1_i1.p2 TRINITY_DN2028_c0_g1~~TRINITY_DN2028_c0_g1_i1.p2  ORF type:complete len:176 (-),score=6.40 TRINITY_DN2028_c0_g1_i1:1185-1712(-)
MRLEVQPEIRHANHFYSIYGIPGNLMSVGDVRSMIAAQDAEEESIAPKPIQKNNKSPIIRRLTSEVSSTVSKSMESVRVDRAEDKDKGEDAHIKPLASERFQCIPQVRINLYSTQSNFQNFNNWQSSCGHERKGCSCFAISQTKLAIPNICSSFPALNSLQATYTNPLSSTPEIQ